MSEAETELMGWSCRLPDGSERTIVADKVRVSDGGQLELSINGFPVAYLPAGSAAVHLPEDRDGAKEWVYFPAARRGFNVPVSWMCTWRVSF